MLSAYQDTVYQLQNTAENCEKIESYKSKAYLFELICAVLVKQGEYGEDSEDIRYG